MAAKKSSSSKKSSSAKKKSSPKAHKGPEQTPAKASKQSKQEHRRPAVAPGDIAGAEYNPARTEEGERVAQTGANPRASRAGIFTDLGEVGKADSDAPYKVSIVDGGAFQLSVGSTQGDVLNRDEAIQLRKLIDQALL